MSSLQLLPKYIEKRKLHFAKSKQKRILATEIVSMWSQSPKELVKEMCSLQLSKSLEFPFTNIITGQNLRDDDNFLPNF